jgi:hypothetical protein
MAFNPGINRDEEEENQNAQQGGTNQLGTAGGVIGGQTAQEGQAQKGKGSGFTNIGQYLEANKADIPGQTQAAVGKVGDKYKNATQSVLASQEAFNQAADQGRGAYVQGATNAEDARRIVGENLKNDKVIDDNDRSTWNSYATSEYKGPNELDNSFQPEATEAKDWSSTLATSDGYFPMMGKMFGQGRSDYNNGMQRLDGSLISADPNARASFEDFNRNAAPTLDATVDSARQGAAQKATQYQAESDMTRQGARDALEKDVLPEYMRGLVGDASGLNQGRRFTYTNASKGGGDNMTFDVANPFAGGQQSQAYDELVRYADPTREDYTDDYNKGWGERLQAEIAGTKYGGKDTYTGTITNPLRSDYTTYGGDVGLGAMSEEDLVKLEALFGMSGNQDLRNSLESEAAATLGFEDIMRNGSGDAFKFDQAGYDAALKRARDAETQRITDWAAEERARAFQAQEALYNKNMK